MTVFSTSGGKPPPRISTLALTAFFCALAAGCDARTSDAATARPPAEQQPENVAASAGAARDVRQECLGRLVFDVRQALEWPSYFNRDASDPFYAVFGKYGRGDSANLINIGNAQGLPANNVRFVRWGPGAKDLEDTLRNSYQLARTAKLNDYRSALETAETDVRELSAKAEPDADTKATIADRKKDIAKVKERIAKFGAQWRTLDPGLPDSFGFQKDDLLRAYMRQGDYLLAFGSHAARAETPEAHEQRFLSALKSFKVRADYEIPAEQGICVPGGFFRDDGTTPIKVKQDFRFADGPRVFYSIATGNVDPKLGPEASGFTATAKALALAGQVGNNLGDRRLLSRRTLGPTSVNIGELRAQQGGVALTMQQDTCTDFGHTQNSCKPEKHPDPFEMYSVFTGYSGSEGAQASPFIAVELYTVSPLEAPQLGPNPPPYAQSKARLDALLGSIRLRPAQPPK